MNPRSAAALLALACAATFAAPLVPSSDDQVIERLPAGAAPAPQPASASGRGSAARALDLVAQARRSGDPRPVGQALALLAPWRDDVRAPAPLVIALAQAEQFVHDFEPARRRLQALVVREPAQAQAWLMLATLDRLQGRYGASDTACDGVVHAGAALHGAACRAENDALRGRFDAARASLQRLLPIAREAPTQAWLWTTLAELEQRAGRAPAAEAALRAALRAQPDDGYAAIALADLCLAAGRGDDARRVLAGRPDSDAVLLRVAAANPRDDIGRGAADTLRRRFAQADLRPGTSSAHARERAQFALQVEGDAPAALRHARVNVRTQREPLDLLLLARSARAAGDAQALSAARALVKEIGLEDQRLDTVW
jgi:tetratricopeptide (TPR) repeat protein